MAIYKQDLAICPWCAGESGQRVDHLYDEAPRNFGSWDCKNCGMSFQGRVNAPGDVTIEKDERSHKNRRALTLLKFESKDGPTFFVIDHKHYGAPEPDAEIQERDRYLYEEHSCPTNWLRDCIAVIHDGDADPHGFLTFVRSVEVSDGFDDNDDGQWPILFPEAFGGETIDGTAAEIKAALPPPESESH